MNNNYLNLKKILQDIISNKKSALGLKYASNKLLKEFLLISKYTKYSIKGRAFINPSKDKIQIGGGSHTLLNFYNIDIVPPADLICDVREGLPLIDKSCSFVFSEHFLEHIDYPISAKKFMKECFRILKNGGELVIGVPDSELMVNNYVKRDKTFYKKAIRTWYSKRNFLLHINTYIDLLNFHFRDQNDKKYNSHLWAYDREKLKSIMEEVGFKKVSNWKIDDNIINPKRKFGSIYMIGKK